MPLGLFLFPHQGSGPGAWLTELGRLSVFEQLLESGAERLIARIELQGSAVELGRFFQVSGTLLEAPEGDERWPEVGRKLDRNLEMPEGLRVAAAGSEKTAEVVVQVGVPRLEPQGLGVFLDRVLDPALALEHLAQVLPRGSAQIARWRAKKNHHR